MKKFEQDILLNHSHQERAQELQNIFEEVHQLETGSSATERAKGSSLLKEDYVTVPRQPTKEGSELQGPSPGSPIHQGSKPTFGKGNVRGTQLLADIPEEHNQATLSKKQPYQVHLGIEHGGKTVQLKSFANPIRPQ